MTLEAPVSHVRQRGLWLEVDMAEQQLVLWRARQELARYTVSTGANGAGERNASGQTPRGWHQVRAKIGAAQPMGTVFRGRRPTGEVYSRALEETDPERDWILTRILWLSGLEPGLNRFGEVDTMRRYIYIHGGPESRPVGVPNSKGCIRMRNPDVVALFDQVPAHTPVLIHE